jgi:hypothetical protein
MEQLRSHKAPTLHKSQHRSSAPYHRTPSFTILSLIFCSNPSSRLFTRAWQIQLHPRPASWTGQGSHSASSRIHRLASASSSSTESDYTNEELTRWEQMYEQGGSAGRYVSSATTTLARRIYGYFGCWTGDSLWWWCAAKASENQGYIVSHRFILSCFSPCMDNHCCANCSAETVLICFHHVKFAS